MDTIKAMMTRRSIRRFQEREIEEGKIETLLRAAMQAPSGHNHQPWHFIVITERRILSAIPEFHPYAKMLHQAPAAITICGDTPAAGNTPPYYSDRPGSSGPCGGGPGAGGPGAGGSFPAGAGSSKPLDG